MTAPSWPTTPSWVVRLGGGWLRVEQVKVGKHAFVGNSGMTAPGRRVPKRGLVAVLSAAPRRTKAKAGTSWLGSPPTELRRLVETGDSSRTYDPPARLRVARAGRLCRLAAVFANAALFLAVAGHRADGPAQLVARRRADRPGPPPHRRRRRRAGSARQWALVGRVQARDYPLWSLLRGAASLADHLELLAAPWLARGATGTPVLNVAPRPRRADREGRLVRDLLAAGARPGRRRCDRQPRLRGADAPLP